MITEAIILAGGFGTRLQNVVKDVPKPMANINGKPFLVYVLDYLKKYEIEHVILSVGHLHETISNYFGNEYNGIKINYAVENKPLGTGGAIKFGFSKIESEAAFVLNGDTIFNIDLRELETKHLKSKADISLALRKIDDLSRYGAVETNDKHRIIAFNEKGTKSGAGNINGGIYLINKAIFEKINTFTTVFSMEKDIFETYFINNKFFGFDFDNYFIDIGIPEDYKKAINELSKIF